MMEIEKLLDLEGLVTQEVGTRLALLAYQVRHHHAIVELGSYKGKSTCYLAAGAEAGGGAHVWAFDAWDLPGNPTGKHGYAEGRMLFDRQIAAVGLGHRITATQSFSANAAKGWSLPIGLLFIDASHLYEDVKRDFEAWSPFVVPGGVVAFDDYKTKRNPGVEQFISELIPNPEWDSWDFATPPLAICRRAISET